MINLDDQREKLVLIGNGMAGINTIEQILKLAPEKYEITVIGKEPHPNYNRIQLSYLLEGSKTFEEIILNDYAWYEKHRIQLYTGVQVERINLTAKQVQASDGILHSYDKLIIATGSNPMMLPIPGIDKQGIVSFRDVQDCERMTSASQTWNKAAVIGGGLLGLEAAKGLLKLGMEVTVVHLFPDLMERQLDPAASAMLKAELEEQGIRFLLNKKTTAICGGTRVESLQFEDGSSLETDFLVMAVGITPEISLARGCGIETAKGIIVDDYMRTSAEGVFAVGECTQHRGISYGLVAPLFEQGAVLAKHLCGLHVEPYQGSVISTKLKISGVDVFSAGEFQDTPGLDVIRMQDQWKKTYKKVLLRDNRIVGCVLFGDISDSAQLFKWVKAHEPMTREIHEQLVGSTHVEGTDSLAFVSAMPSDEIVCGCNGVTKGMIVQAITDHGLSTVEEIKRCTGASRSCGGCKPMVEQILTLTLGDQYKGSGNAVETVCSCTSHSREDVIAAIREKRLTHVREVMNVLEWHNPEGCTKCRPAINYYIGMVWPEAFEDEKDSRFVNERLHANIQKDGTYSVHILGCTPHVWWCHDAGAASQNS